MHIYLKGNVWVEIADGSQIAIVGDEFQCLDADDHVLARFTVTDVQLYSRVRPDSGADDDAEGRGSTASSASPPD